MYIIDSLVNSGFNYLNEIRKTIGNNLVFLKFNLSPANINYNFDVNLYEEVINFYLSNTNKNENHEYIYIPPEQDINITDEQSLISNYQLFSYLTTLVLHFSNYVKVNKKTKTDEFFILSKLDGDFLTLKNFVIKNMIEFLESFIKIRGDYISNDIKEDIIKLLDYLKKEDFTQNLEEFDEIWEETIKKNQDYEYYILSKDKIFLSVPSSYIWFEFLLHIAYLYENKISINSFDELYEKRVRPSFEISKNWYKTFYNNIIAKESLKVELYNSILDKLEEAEKYIEKVYITAKQKYPEKFELNEQYFIDILTFLYEKTTELTKLSLQLEENKLKGTGIFENFYKILKEIYYERESLLILYEFHNSIQSTLNNLEEESNFITTIDKKILENREKFENLLDLILKFIEVNNKDIIIDIIDYFQNNLESLILDLKEDSKKLEKLLEPEKIICVNCGHSNDSSEEYCKNCGKKLIKPTTESKGTIKLLLSKLYKTNDKEEIISILSLINSILNNILSNINSIKNSLDSLKGEPVTEIIIKIENIIEAILSIKDKMNYLSSNKELIIQELEKLRDEMEQQVYNMEKQSEELYNYIKNLSQEVN